MADLMSRRRTDAVPVLTVALLFVLLAQVSRTLFTGVYEAFEDDAETAGAIALAVFAAPLVTLAVARREPRRLALGGVIVVAVARLAVQLWHPIPLGASIVATAAALAGVTACVPFVGSRLRGVGLLEGIIVGLALDAAIRGPTRGWDVVWQGSFPAVAVTIVLIAAALLGVWLLVERTPPSDVGAVGYLWAIGPYLALQLLFLQNVGYVASQGDVSFEAAALVVLGGDVLALATVVWAAARRIPLAAVVGMLVGAAVVGGSVHGVTGAAAIALVLVLQIATSASLAVALSTRPSRSSATRVVIAMTVASLSFLLLALLWQIDVTLPLPFPRDLIAALGAALVGAAAVLAVRADRAPTRDEAWPLAPFAVTCVLAVLLPSALWLDRPRADIVPATTSDVRLVSFNVRGAVDPDGQLDADAIADSIEAFHPDIVVLQEVARGWVIHGTADLLAYLHDRLDMPYVFEPAADPQFGHAIFTHLPFRRIGGGELPPVAGKQRRSYVAVTVDVAGRPLVVIDMQLETSSEKQIGALLDEWGGATPAVIAGDPNVQPDDPDAELFTGSGLIDAATAVGRPCETTSAEPKHECDRPDWVFLTSDLDIGTFRVGAASASDHLPIYVTFSLGAA